MFCFSFDFSEVLFSSVDSVEGSKCFAWYLCFFTVCAFVFESDVLFVAFLYYCFVAAVLAVGDCFGVCVCGYFLE